PGRARAKPRSLTTAPCECDDRFVRDRAADGMVDAAPGRPAATPADRGAAPSTRPDAILALQRSAGNRAVTGMILQRQPVEIPEVTVVGEPTDREQMKAIQRE